MIELLMYVFTRLNSSEECGYSLCQQFSCHVCFLACSAFSLVFQPDSPMTAQQSHAVEHLSQSAESTFKCFDIRGSVAITVHLAPAERADSQVAPVAATLAARRTAGTGIASSSTSNISNSSTNPALRVSVPILAKACRSLLVCDLAELAFDHCAIAQSHAVSRECTVWNRSEIATRFSFRFASMHPHTRAFDVLDCESGMVVSVSLFPLFTCSHSSMDIQDRFAKRANVFIGALVFCACCRQAV